MIWSRGHWHNVVGVKAWEAGVAAVITVAPEVTGSTGVEPSQGAWSIVGGRPVITSMVKVMKFQWQEELVFLMLDYLGACQGASEAVEVWLSAAAHF